VHGAINNQGFTMLLKHLLLQNGDGCGLTTTVVSRSGVTAEDANSRIGRQLWNRKIGGLTPSLILTPVVRFKKWENLKAALALYFAYYNFVQPHSKTRCIPAMEAGITDRPGLWRDLCSKRQSLLKETIDFC